MSEIDREKFKQYWRKTEVIREYRRMLFTFGDIELPYVFVAESQLKDRAVVRKGTIVLERPYIVLPDSHSGPEFKEGFEHTPPLPPEVAYLFRAAKLPYSRITNKPLAEEQMEYGSLQAVLDKFYSEMDSKDDTVTGLIKGLFDGTDVSLMRYSLGLAIKSAPGNISEFFEHLRRQRGEPIRADEKITDEEIRRLFG